MPSKTHPSGAIPRVCETCGQSFPPMTERQWQNARRVHEQTSKRHKPTVPDTTANANVNVAGLSSVYLYPIEKILWLVCLLLWSLGLFASPWIFIPAVLLTLYLGAFFYANNSTRWRRFYLRISMMYARVAGAQSSWCKRQGIPFDCDMAWRPVLEKIYPSKADVEAFLLLRYLWRRDCDRSLVERITHKLNPAVSEAEIDSAFTYFKTGQKNSWVSSGSGSLPSE
jgi:hypothetical protein